MNPPQLRTRIGKYQLIATLGRGGMAHIYLARLAGPLGFNKLFVIKVLREDLAEGHEDAVTMFLDEARLAARLSHPNIVQTFDVGDDDGRYFIAMEYLEGQCLRTVDKRLGQRLPLAHHLRVLSELGKALHHAHELCGYDGEPLCVVHRDVSPQNVFVTYDGQVKLLDFGIAKAENAVHLTRVGLIKGKAEYIAPEQVRGEPVDRRADVFALGVMLFEALSGTRFAGGPQVAEVAKLHLRATGGERKLREVAPQVHEALARVCDRALAMRPEERHATALEFAAELDAWLASHLPLPTAEGLARIIGPAFHDERQRLRKLIDEQMMQDSEQLALLELRESTRSLGGRKSLTPTGERLVVPEPSSAPRSGSSSAPRPSAPPATEAEVVAALRPDRRIVAAVAGAALALIIGGVLLAVQPTPRSAQASAAEPLPPARISSVPPVRAAKPPVSPGLDVHVETERAEPVKAAPAKAAPAEAASEEPEAQHGVAARRPAKKRLERPHRPERAPEPPTATRPAEPAPAHTEDDDFEPGADLRGLTPAARRSKGQIELEEDAYE